MDSHILVPVYHGRRLSYYNNFVSHAVLVQHMFYNTTANEWLIIVGNCTAALVYKSRLWQLVHAVSLTPVPRIHVLIPRCVLLADRRASSLISVFVSNTFVVSVVPLSDLSCFLHVGRKTVWILAPYLMYSEQINRVHTAASLGACVYEQWCRRVLVSTGQSWPLLRLLGTLSGM